MDALTIATGPCDIGFRGTTVGVTDHMIAALERMRAALITCALRGTTLTYSELVLATGRAYNRRQFGLALDVLTIDCQNREEPSLAALVVHKGGDGDVGSGFIGDAAAERSECYQHWQEQA
jgi:hypothetical protein